MSKVAIDIPSHVVLHAATTIPDGIRLVGVDDETKLTYRLDLSTKEIPLGARYQIGKDGVLYAPGKIPRQKRIKQKSASLKNRGEANKK